MAPTLDPICGSYVVPTDLASEEQNLVGVFSGWRVLRGTEEEVSPDEGIYQQAVRDWLTEHGVIRPEVRITRILRVDIETDGVDEAFISASHFAEPTGHTTQAGDYSIVLMRRVVLGTIRTIALVEEYYDSVDPILTFPRTYSLDHVMDLNDDGILDVVLGIQHWEGYGAQAYEISDQDVIQVLAAQCGL